MQRYVTVLFAGRPNLVEIGFYSMIKPVIMAGGTGSRLWPLSRTLYPKQFIALNGEQTMLQETVSRLSGLQVTKPLIICNEEYRFIVAEQLREINKSGEIILEPVGRNTAPAIALAAIVNEKNDPLLLVLAADHVIQDKKAFVHAVNIAAPLAQQGKLVTFGIVPTQAHTGYGYIKRGDPVKKNESYKVNAFVEKPNKETAKQYLSSGEYYWNSGMFLIKASRYIQELKKYNVAIFNACKKALTTTIQDQDFLRLNVDAFKACPDDSIDYAVMEKTADAVVVPLDAGWSDIGSWSALWEVNNKSRDANVTTGDVILYNSKNTFVRGDARLIAAVGLENIVIVDTKDALLVAHKDKVQEVKKIVEQLKKKGRSEFKIHREVHRPWGKYDLIDHGERVQVRRITVNPGGKLSLQRHQQRSEHWIVVSGTAKVTKGDHTFLMTENESTYIPFGVVHALENPGKLPLEMIEVQSGPYLGEDDIVRF